jgi:uncharacterized protein YciI
VFLILHRLSDDKGAAGQHKSAHDEWVQRGLDDGVFLLVGTIQPRLGGAIWAHNTTLAELEKRVSDDPFVAENIVRTEILEIAPNLADERLGFLL